MSKQSIEVGARLKLAREKKGLTREEVAEILGKKSERTIRRYERGENLTIQVFEELCALYEINSIHIRYSQKEIIAGFVDTINPEARLVIEQMANALKK